MRIGHEAFYPGHERFSKKVKNPMHAISIYFMHYNFVRIHQTLGRTPAMEAGVTNQRWSLQDMVVIVDEWEDANRSSTTAL